MDYTKNAIQRFSNSLSAAIYDKKIEDNNFSITYYYDADVIYSVVMGFMDNFPDINYKKNDQQLVNALLSSGHLGKFSLLRPHAFEFYKKINHQTRYSTKTSKINLYRKVKQYINNTNLSEDMINLYEIINSKNKTNESKVEDFISVLRMRSIENFSFIEQLNGIWSQRLRRYYDNNLIDLDNLGPDIGELMDTDKKDLEEINRILSKSRPDKSYNSFQDSLAIVILGKFIKNRDSNISQKTVRFYTDTNLLIKSITENEFIRDYLSYNFYLPEIGQYNNGKENIFRNRDYFIVRTMFNELLPNSEKANLERLTSFSASLIDVLNSTDDHIVTAYNTLAYDGNLLLEVIDNFEELSIVENLWVKGNIPNHLLEYENLSKWVDIYKFAKEDQTEAVIHSRVIDIREKIESQIIIFSKWMTDFRVILKQGQDKQKELLNVINDPIRDIGLVRWGYKISNDDKDKITNIIADISSANLPQMTGIAMNIATIVENGRKDVRQCHIGSAILWALGLFNELIVLVNDCESNNLNVIPSALNVMKIAAELRSGDRNNPEEIKGFSDGIGAIEAKTSKDDRLSILLGIGYVFYHFWKNENIGRTRIEKNIDYQSVEAISWAERSFIYGEEAFKNFPKKSLGWAFSINHCAYLGTVTGVFPDKTEEYIERLLTLKNNSYLWNPRFADTMGCYYLSIIENRWKSTKEENRIKLDFSNEIDSAKTFFYEAKNMNPGDIDIEEHIGILDLFINKIEKRKSH